MTAETPNRDDVPEQSAASEARGPGRPPGGGDSRELILDAALTVFLRDGLSASVRDIAAEAGVTQAALYYYFPTKHDLLLEAARNAAAVFGQVVALASPEGEPEEVLRRVADGYLSTFAVKESSRLMATLLSEGIRTPGFMPEIGQRLREGVFGPVIGYLRTLREEGRLGADVEPVVVAQMLFGSLFSFMVAREVIQAQWLKEVDPDALAEDIARILVHGIAGAGEPATDWGGAAVGHPSRRGGASRMRHRRRPRGALRGAAGRRTGRRLPSRPTGRRSI